MAKIKYGLHYFTEVPEHPLFAALQKCVDDFDYYADCALLDDKSRYNHIQNLCHHLHDAAKLACKEYKREWCGSEHWILENRKNPATSHK